MLFFGISLYVAFFSMLVLWKYSHFYYDNLDLAIFNNVFWNTLHGSWFEASIHPPSYLGDHFAPGIFLLLPFYAIAPRPETLLILQTVALALGAFPVYLIAKKMLRSNTPWLPLFVACLWLVNPVVHNMNVFEFELMSFAVLGLLWSVWSFLENKPFLFAIATVLTVSVREDFVFIVFIFGIIALIEKRSLFWKLYPLLLSICWAVLAFSIIGLYAPQGSYKFLRYYGWLGGTDLVSVAWSFVIHPVKVLMHIVSWYNIEFVLGLLFPFFFFISLRIRYSLLLIPPAAQIMLAGFGGSGLILGTYYAGYLVAILFILFAHRLSVFTPDAMPTWLPMELKSKKVLYSLILLACVYSALMYGSLGAVALQWNTPNHISEKNKVLAIIPDDAAVAATYDLLPAVSSRRSVYLFPYAMIGKNQFALKDYPLPADTRYLLIDWDDIVLAQMHFSSNRAFSPFSGTVENTMRTILSSFRIVSASGSLMLLERSQEGGTVEKLMRSEPYDAASGDTIHLQRNESGTVAIITLQGLSNENTHHYVQITADGETTRIPIAYGLLDRSTMTNGIKIIMPLFLWESKTPVTIALYRWSKASIVLSGIKNILTASDATLVREAQL